MTRILTLMVVVFAFSIAAQAQTDVPQAPSVPQRDSQAVLVLGQALGAAGGAALGAIQDFTGTGTITYYWAGEEVQGSVTVRGRGANQFRLDANLPTGTRSWTLGNWAGSLKEADGTVRRIPTHNALNLGSLTLPYLGIAAALNDPAATISYVGLVELDGHRAYEIRVRRTFGLHVREAAYFSKLPSKDYFVDATTLLLLKTEDMTRALNTPVQDYPHDVEFSDYRPVNGALVPFSITEEIGGQKTWTIRLESVAFNTGLTTADFQP